MEIHIQDLGHIHEAAREFISRMGSARVFAFYGQMGAGKTTFIKALCEELGVRDVITSPTFAIVNEYSLLPAGSASLASPAASLDSPVREQQAQVVYHFDFYRIKRLEEVYDMGYEDYFYSGALCLMEWPELVEDILPEDAVRVTISAQPDGSRLLAFS